MLTPAHKKISVASPKKIKNPPLSVQAVIITDEPSAGSRPKRTRAMGISTPIVAASNRVSVMARVITMPRAMLE